MTQWVIEKLGPNAPMHFTAFHPDCKLLDIASTPLTTLQRARRIAIKNGVRYAYIGNAHDVEGDSTIVTSVTMFDSTRLVCAGDWQLDANGCCKKCGLAAQVI